MATHSSILARKSHGQRSLLGYNQSIGLQSQTQLIRNTLTHSRTPLHFLESFLHCANLFIFYFICLAKKIDQKNIAQTKFKEHTAHVF